MNFQLIWFAHMFKIFNIQIILPKKFCIFILKLTKAAFVFYFSPLHRLFLNLRGTPNDLFISKIHPQVNEYNRR